jgi:hypothetical protein
VFEASLVFGGGALGNEHGVVDAYPRVVLDTVHGILAVIPGGGGEGRGGGGRRGEERERRESGEEKSKEGGETLVSLLSMEDEVMKIPKIVLLLLLNTHAACTHAGCTYPRSVSAWSTTLVDISSDMSTPRGGFDVAWAMPQVIKSAPRRKFYRFHSTGVK